jgi:hypothetical protein
MMDLSILVFFQRWVISNKAEQSYIQIAAANEGNPHVCPRRKPENQR